MVQRKAPESVTAYTRHLKRQYPGLRKVYLFGSHAKGKAHEDSDIDIAVVFDNIADSFDLQVELMKIRRQYDMRIEPHVFRTADFEKINPLAAEILSGGTEL